MDEQHPQQASVGMDALKHWDKPTYQLVRDIAPPLCPHLEAIVQTEALRKPIPKQTGCNIDSNRLSAHRTGGSYYGVLSFFTDSYLLIRHFVAPSGVS